jgi:hypothetical protein
MSIVTIPEIIYPTTRGTINSGSITLDAAEEFYVVVMRVRDSGTLNKITWRTGTITAGTSYVLKVSVETVAATVGQPVATSNAAKTLYAAGAESADITSLSSNTIYHTAINSTTGISVSAGDDIAITFRFTAVNGAIIQINFNQYGSFDTLTEGRAFRNYYGVSYLGSAWAIYPYTQVIALQYSDGFHPSTYLIPPVSTATEAWNSSSNPDRRGIKFKFPVKCRLSGALIKVDADVDIDVILYGSDEYTAVTGFPITITNTNRATAAYGDFVIPFPTKPEINADTFYRLVLLPKSTTNITLGSSTPDDDGSYLGIDQFTEQRNVVYTQRNGAPSSGDHAWTDTNVKKQINLIIDGIEASAGGTGGGTLIGQSSLIG